MTWDPETSKAKSMPGYMLWLARLSVSQKTPVPLTMGLDSRRHVGEWMWARESRSMYSCQNNPCDSCSSNSLPRATF